MPNNGPAPIGPKPPASLAPPPRFRTVDLSHAISITNGDPLVVASPAILTQDAEELKAAFERAFTGPPKGLYAQANVSPSGIIERDAVLPPVIDYPKGIIVFFDPTSDLPLRRSLLTRVRDFLRSLWS